MKTFIQRLSFVAFALVLGGAAANAQATQKFDADIPFDFSIGGKAFPAGKYVLLVSGDHNRPGYLQVRNEKRGLVYTGISLTNGVRATDSAQLRFETVSGQQQLAMIVSDTSGYSIRLSRRAKLIASKKDTDHVVKN